jgi:prepilin-type N-terminal cleavage/methylation domain-containing protein
MKKRKFHNNGFTLVELLTAMMVCAITLTAVAALAFAMGSADDSSDDTSQRQAHLRHATINVSELIRHCRLVVLAIPTQGQVAVWRADDDKNNRINLEEVVYIDRGPGGDCLQLVEFTSMNNPVVSLTQIRPLQDHWWLSMDAVESFTVLIPACNNVQFFFDSPTMPPDQTQIKSLSISFNIFENGVNHNYQINASLRNWAGNLLNEAGDAIVSDDD